MREAKASDVLILAEEAQRSKGIGQGAYLP